MTCLATTFAALSDETRLAMMERLMAVGELPAGDLVADASISGPAVSRHLKVLRNAGLVTQRAEGTKRLYSVRPEALQAVAGWTMDHKAFWQSGLERLDALLAEDKS
ncbi:metalloregulator ArsR/SmtB family transcription factor [Shimia sp. R9_3]|uniref:ArsR/SmtB family transcription factor n=1 Tax=Shimia sp. R9_3 TaxID=2821113 RepID=UPI001AD95E13|nr:metalloregulator ArsR/SmtB family transcription factor [Shimia sp. R9_3]MBO9399415.1 winged helix-turn-helix transcriptional regulator [Shimia sp. R9_3]